MNQHLEPSSSRERELFLAALEKPAGAERASFLEGACRGEAPLRAAVEALLANANDSLLDRVAEEARPTQTVPLSEGPGTQIGRFKILEQIGEGGFGVVYMAEQKEPVRRRVALKIIKLGMDTKEVVARFEAERHALALMDHANVARVLEGGCTETGRPYFVMELVKGRPITKFCDEERLSTVQRLELFISVCRAVQHAHQKGLVHRDLKPSNVLVSFVDGRPVPKIIDFGIAKAMQHDLTDKTVFTRFHQFMGTPAYMSPEQAGTDSADIDTRSDIYSLGVMLYELLTGRTPMDSHELAKADYDEIRRQIREVEPLRPSNRISTLAAAERTTVARSRSADPGKLSRLVCGDLDWIVLKAMEKDRNRRYETANEFAKDLQRHLDNEPVTARKPSLGYVFQKFARRHKVALATAACFALLLTVSAAVSAAQAIKNKSLFTAAEEARLKAMDAQQRETELRRIAQEARGKAEAERDSSQRLLYIANMNLAKKDWDELNVGRAIELLEVHRPQPGQPDLRNFEWFYLDRLCHRDLLTLKGHTAGVGSVAFSPDGKRLASASAEVKVWDATSGHELLTLHGLTNGFSRVVYSPDGKRLAAGSGNQIVMWDALTGEEIRRLEGHTNGVNQVAFSPDGKRLASVAGWFAGEPGEVKLWDTTTGQEVGAFKGHTEGAYAVAFSPDGKWVASGSYQTVTLWDTTTGQEVLTLKVDTASVNALAFSPDGKRLASASSDETLKVWDALTGQETLTLKGEWHLHSAQNLAG
jgi:serine/threonine protein kinase